MVATIGQTVTIFNKSNKLIKTSKHWQSLFADAKSAYIERKAELRSRQTQRQRPLLSGENASYPNNKGGNERHIRQRPEVMTLADSDEDGAGSARSSRRNSEERLHHRQRSHRPSPLRDDTSLAFLHDGSVSPSRNQQLTRRHTDTSSLHSPSHSPQQQHHYHQQRPGTSVRSASADDVDMALAYGDLPPPLPYRSQENISQIELRTRMTALQALLLEANCLQHSAGAIIENLQKNPDTLAAVALTLAEISNMATKMAPGALMGLRGAFPAVLALLLSPEFAIAVGVSVGITVVVLGGYKIVKKIQAKRDAKRLGIEDGGMGDVDGVEELREISKIEHWRRGIENVTGGEEGMSVEGEFVTPLAAGTLIKEGRLRERDLKKKDGRRRERRGKSADEEHGQGSHFGRSRSGVRVNAKEKPAPGALQMLFSRGGV